MSSPEERLHAFPPRFGGQFYSMDKGSAFSSSNAVYSSDTFSANTFLDSTNLKIAANRIQQQILSSTNERNAPVFVLSPKPNHDIQNQPPIENVSAQKLCDRSRSVDNMSNVNPSPDQSGNTSYVNLTWWTTKFASQGLPLTPSNEDALTVPTLPDQQPLLPTAAGPIHFTTRTHKVAPYHNAFSRLSPLQSKPFNKPLNPHGTRADPEVSFPPRTSPADMLKSVSRKENRFKRTAEALHKSGLWDVAMKTGHLIKRNQELQKELEQFKMDALNFLKSVIKNPENRDFIKSVLNSALSAGAAESKKSVMTVVVSAAAAVAAVSVSDSRVCANNVNSEVDRNTKNSEIEKSSSNVLSPEASCGISQKDIFSDRASDGSLNLKNCKI